MIEDEFADELEALINWSRATQDGSLSDLNFVPRGEVWERLCSDSDTCQWTKCSHYHDCFVNRARRRLASADLLIVNHHLLFADLALRMAKDKGVFYSVLPAYSRIILDEAHNIEDVATEYFGDRVTQSGLLRMIARLHSTQRRPRGKRAARGRVRGILHDLLVALDKHKNAVDERTYLELAERISSVVIPLCEALRESCEEMFTMLGDIAEDELADGGADEGEGKLRLTPELLGEWAGFIQDELLPTVVDIRTLAQHASQIQRKLADALRLEEKTIENLSIELRAQSMRLGNACLLLERVFTQYGNEDRVRWIELRRTASPRAKRTVHIYDMPVDVGDKIRAAVLEPHRTVVLTSATLTVDGSFSFIRERLGIARDGCSGRLREISLPSPFDFKKQAIILVPDGLPEPTEDGFIERAVEFLHPLLKVSRGRAFLLFTSFSALDRAHQLLSPALKAAGITPLRQGDDTRDHLIERFRDSTGAVLFATSSFWEGVDVIGESLQCVVIMRLPFKVPTEPIIQARVEALEREGRNAFMEYTVPQTVIKFRQGIGRLIRHRNDRGAIIVMDRRVLTRRYGRVFLNSLPPAPLIQGGCSELREVLEEFFKKIRTSKATT